MGKYVRNWDLDNIYKSMDSAEFKKDYEYMEKTAKELVKKVEKLPKIDTNKECAKKWEDFQKELTEYTMIASQMFGYVNNLFSADAENEKYPAMLGRLSNIHLITSPVYIKISFMLKEADDKTFETFINNSPLLKEIEFVMHEDRNQALYMMDKDREELAAQLSKDGITAWGKLYDKISGRLKVKVMEKGELVEKSIGLVRTDSEERTVRQNNFYGSIKAWDSIKHLCAEALNHIAGTRLTLYKEQGFKHFLDKPLMDNRLKKESLNTMFDAIKERKSMFKKYFDIKAKLLGLDKMTWYDMSAPIKLGKIDFDTAMDTVISEYTKFNPVMGQFVKNCAEKGYIESEKREGKRQGAYCMGFNKKKEPRVFMTFIDGYRSMSTLAHELGHAFHSFVLKDRPYQLQNYPMNLAETASTFGEAIIGDYLVNNAKNKEEKIGMLDKLISDASVYMMNVHSRFIFECKFYEKRSEGELTAEELTELMLEAEKEGYMNLLDEYHPLYWASTLHFYISGLSFYNFPYAFGYMFSGTLYSLAKEEGPSFADKYNQVLIDTGCKNTEDVIKDNLGMDISKKDFWYKSIDLVKGWIDELDKLTKDM